MSRVIRALLLAVLVPVLAACPAGVVHDPQTLVPPSSLVIVGGEAQRDTVDATLAAPLVVEVRDASGHPVPNVAVTWQVDALGGALHDLSATSDGGGRATAQWTLGAATGAVHAQAIVGTLQTTFTATVDPGAPARLTMTPATASLTSLGDTVQLAATATDRLGHALPTPAVTYRALDPTVLAVATVGTQGIAVARANGSTAVIAATASGAADTTPVVVLQRVARLTVTPTPVTLLVGDTAHLIAQPVDARGAPVADAAIIWTSSAPTVLDASRNDGTGIALMDGTATVSATSSGITGTASVTVRRRPVASVVVTPATTTMVSGTSATFTARLTDAAGVVLTGRVVSWSSSNSTVASVDGAGLVTTRAAGAATITATSEGVAGSASVTVVAGAAAVVTVASGDGQTAVVASALPQPLVVRVTDAVGNAVSGATVTWASATGGTVSPGAATTAADGTARTTWTLPTLAGATTATATVSGLPVASFHATATAGAVQSLRVTPATPTLTAVGQTVTIVAQPLDQYGNATTAPALTWSSAAPAVATVSTTGVVTSTGPGTATITATTGSVRGTATVTVDLGTTPWVAGVAPDTLRPGATATITGQSFGATPSGNVVTIAGVTATVTSASATSLTVTVPALAVFPCLPTGPVTVRVAVGAQTATRTSVITGIAVRQALSVGASAIISDTAALRCSELPATGGRYYLSVYNAARDSALTAAVSVRGIGGTTAALTSAMTAMTRAAPLAGAGHASPWTTGWATPADLRRSLATPARSPRPVRSPMGLEGDGRMVDAGLALVRRLGSPRDALRQRQAMLSARQRAAAALAPSVGSTRTFQVVDPHGDICNAATPITARAVYAGTRVVIYEDQAAPLAGTQDTIFQRLGREFEQRQFAMLSTYFGDPLAMSASLDNSGLVTVVATPKVNAAGLLGFVSGGDFYPGCTASNLASMVYLSTPSATSQVEEYRREVGTVLAHEAKHLTAFAEGFAHNYVFATSWLEESTAQIASELWGRQQYGYAQGSNTTYAQSLQCERSATGCAGVTNAVRDAWNWLNGYYTQFESHGLLSNGDATARYGGDWLFVRWAADQSGVPEATFFRNLIATTQSSLPTLEQQSGMAWDTMLGEFSLAMIADDYPTTIANPHLRHPSWNTRNIVSTLWGGSGLSTMQQRPVAYGNFQADFTGMVGGGAAVFDLSGTQSAAQAIALGTANGTLPAGVRLAIVRVQ